MFDIYIYINVLYGGSCHNWNFIYLVFQFYRVSLLLAAPSPWCMRPYIYIYIYILLSRYVKIVSLTSQKAFELLSCCCKNMFPCCR